MSDDEDPRGPVRARLLYPSLAGDPDDEPPDVPPPPPPDTPPYELPSHSKVSRNGLHALHRTVSKIRRLLPPVVQLVEVSVVSVVPLPLARQTLNADGMG